MKLIEKSYDINASPEKVFQALTQPKLIEKWSGSKAKMTDKAGEPFSLFDGTIFGKNVEVVPNKKLVQDWYAEKWTIASRVTIDLKPSKQTTQINLRHEDVPDKSYNSINEGWTDSYFNPLKTLLES